MDLLDSALDEVLLREPEYFRRFVVHVPVALDLRRYRSIPVFEACGDDELARVLARGLEHLERRGVILGSAREPSDPVMEVLLDSAMDAFGATALGLSLRPRQRTGPGLREVLASDYHQGTTPNGIRYVIRRRGAQPLILVNAVGLPLGTWRQLLTDRSHDFRVIAVESRASDLLLGGMRAHVDVEADARDIADVLKHESIQGASLLAWCNGGRVALALAAANADRIRRLVLLSTTMMGFTKSDLRCSMFEENLNEVFFAVRRRPALAEFSSSMLRDRPALDWNDVGDDVVRRAQTLLRLPAKDMGDALLAPVATGASLQNYARRGESDGAFPLDDVLRQLTMPILLITGSDDEIVNNALTVAALATANGRVTHLEVSGAGHYINDLQYSYLIWALERWVGGHGPLTSTARVRVSEEGLKTGDRNGHPTLKGA